MKLTEELRGWRRCWEYIRRIYIRDEGWEYIDSESGHLFKLVDYVDAVPRYLAIPTLADDYEPIPNN